ncbi:DUF2850 domain-containing protein [Vibrio salilacus]|uniref:DUF2850 domain-containing protein n=1 Tax=Vibrio salilacus TaxID=1323749 RepID=UPI000C2A5AB4|nr:DUF2850 domain-containing protein [Vibrio salilacus]
MSTLSRGNKKIIERTIVIVALFFAVVVVVLADKLYDRYLAKVYPKSAIYGIWVEQNVAAYSTDKFMLSSAGVAVDGGVVDTHFDWNGSYLEYNVGDKVRRYKVLNEQMTEIQLVSEAHYQPVFRLSRKYQDNIH